MNNVAITPDHQNLCFMLAAPAPTLLLCNSFNIPLSFSCSLIGDGFQKQSKNIEKEWHSPALALEAIWPCISVSLNYMILI